MSWQDVFKGATESYNEATHQEKLAERKFQQDLRQKRQEKLMEQQIAVEGIKQIIASQSGGGSEDMSLDYGPVRVNFPGASTIEKRNLDIQKSRQDVAQEQDKLRQMSIFSGAIPRYRRYATHEIRTQDPAVAAQRIAQLQGKLSSSLPLVSASVKSSFEDLAPKTTAKQYSLNAKNLARGMAQMFKNTEAAAGDTSEIESIQRAKGNLARASAWSGFGTNPRAVGEIATQKVRARAFLKNFENNRFTKEDIEDAIGGMTDIGKTTAERLGILTNTLTAAAAANGISEEQIMPFFLQELGISASDFQSILNRESGSLERAGLRKSKALGQGSFNSASSTSGKVGKYQFNMVNR